MQTFLETSFQNVNSDKRTDVLHAALLDEVLNANPAWAEYDWKFEYRLPVDGYGGTFKLDIAGFVDGVIKVVILAKAANSNVAKNNKNYGNTSVGEAARLIYAPDIDLEKVLFISIAPRVAPRFKKSCEVGGFDKVVSSRLRTNIAPVLKQQYGDKVQAIDLMYDIVNVKQKKTKDDFSDIIVENLDELVIA